MEKGETVLVKEAGKVNTGALQDKTVKPSIGILTNALGKTFAYYSELSAMTQGYQADWSYTKSVGWMQKTSDRKKALFYLIPLKEAFLLRMTVREGEREALLQNALVWFAHDALANAKKYSEGFLMEFTVTDDQSFEETQLFVTEVMRLRQHLPPAYPQYSDRT